MRLAGYIPFAEGMSPFGMLVAGAIVGVVGVPLLKRGVLRGLAVGLTGGAMAMGNRLKGTARGHAGWWRSVAEEARFRREKKMTGKTANQPGHREISIEKGRGEQPDWTFSIRRGGM